MIDLIGRAGALVAQIVARMGLPRRPWRRSRCRNDRQRCYEIRRHAAGLRLRRMFGGPCDPLSEVTAQDAAVPRQAEWVQDMRDWFSLAAT
ncbi:hypothetical protein D5047_17505 [Verminephrobacter eiseniae]|nr:hypothetical protein [Verminephrobacter eiseniae]